MSKFSSLAICFSVLSVALSATAANVTGAEPPPNDASALDPLIDRFVKALEKNPQEGIALDRVFSYRAEIGMLDSFRAKYQSPANGDVSDDAARMIVGLIEAQRGRDVAAADAFARAVQANERNAPANILLTRTFIRLGEAEGAVDVLQLAIASAPPRAELIDAYFTLGRLYQRMMRQDDALAVWQRLEVVFPHDPEIFEQIAATLAVEGQHDEARRRYEALAASSSRDLHRQCAYQIEAASLALRMRQPGRAIDEFDAVLEKLQPDGWLHHQVRVRIELAFMQADDDVGLVEYYKRRLASHSDDLGAIEGLARALSRTNRAAEAVDWLQRAVDLAPSRGRFREALIGELVLADRIAEAAKQCEVLHEANPNDEECVRDWAALILRDDSRDEAERQQAATEIWMKLDEQHPDDAKTAAQVADLLASARIFTAAESLYRRAVRLRPDDVQYHERLGAFLHNQQRESDALDAWQQMAAPPHETAQRLTRLATILSRYDYDDAAIDAAQAACAAAPDDFDTHLTLADVLANSG